MEHTEKLAKIYPDAEVWIRDSWEHFIVKGCDFVHVAENQEYCERILEFLQTVD